MISLIITLVSMFLFDLKDMDCLIVFSFINALYPSTINLTDIYSDYIDQKYTRRINGFCTLYIFFTHSRGYIKYKVVGMRIYLFFCIIIKQLIVTPFLFFSGYGISEKIKSKGSNYINHLFRYRIPTIYLTFVISVFIFVFQGYALSIHYSSRRILLTFLCWKAVGNSTWYVLVILLMYLCTFVSYKAFYPRSQSLAIAALYLETITVYFTLKYYRPHTPWYYNTLFCYPSGILYSVYRSHFDALLQKNNFAWLSSLFTVSSFFSICYKKAFIEKSAYELFWTQITANVFILIIVLLMMKIHIENPILGYLGGKYQFGHFLLQRIPMQYLQQKYKDIKPGIFFIASVLLTIILSRIFTLGTNCLTRFLRLSNQY